jgi:hypothetical protein
MKNLIDPTIQQYQNLYEVRKTIRFVLVPQKNSMMRSYQPDKNSGDLQKDIEKFIKKYSQIIQKIEELIFIQRKNSKDKFLNKKVSIKHSWLRTYTKTDSAIPHMTKKTRKYFTKQTHTPYTIR